MLHSIKQLIVGYIKKTYKVLLEFSILFGAFATLYFVFSQLSVRYSLIVNPTVGFLLIYSAALLLIMYIVFLLWVNVLRLLKYTFRIPFIGIAMRKINDEKWEVDKNIKLISQRSDIFRYVDRYFWTGSGKVIPSTSTPGVTVKNACKIRHIDYVDYCFNRHLHSEENVNLGIKYIAYDEDHEAQNYVATTVKSPTDKIELSVILPEKDLPDTARYIINKDGASGDNKAASGYVPFNGNTAKVIFPSKEFPFKPTLGHYYKLYW